LDSQRTGTAVVFMLCISHGSVATRLRRVEIFDDTIAYFLLLNKEFWIGRRQSEHWTRI